MFGSRAPARTALRVIQSRNVSNATELTAPPPSKGILEMIFNRSSMPQVPLNHGFPDLPELRSVAPQAYATEVSTLDNGIKVVSCDGAAPVSTVSCFVTSGSRHETLHNSGTSHFLEYMAFKSTTNRSDFLTVREMGKIGAQLSCVAGRENTVYTGDCLQEHVPEVLRTLADVIQNNKFDSEEMHDGVATYKAYVDELRKAGNNQLVESLHAAAYHGNTLGMPLYGTLDSYFERDALMAHMRAFTANHIVVAGVGVKHGDLVSLVSKNFELETGEPAVAAKSMYTGGDVRLHNDADTTKLAVCFESASINSAEAVTVSVLQNMLTGRGNSVFSASYSDSGMFGLMSNVEKQRAGESVDEMCAALEGMVKPAEAGELAKAKNAAKSAILQRFECRASKSTAMGTQMASLGKAHTVQEMSAAVDAVQASDLTRVATAMLKTPVSLAVHGNAAFVPRYDTIAQRFA